VANRFFADCRVNPTGFLAEAQDSSGVVLTVMHGYIGAVLRQFESDSSTNATRTSRN
jgi:hypothetical protein